MSNFKVGDLISFKVNLSKGKWNYDYRTRYFLILSDTVTTFRLIDITKVETLNFRRERSVYREWDQFDEKLSVKNISQQEIDKILATKTYHKKNRFVSKKKKDFDETGEYFRVKKITLNQTEYIKDIKCNEFDWGA